MGKTIPKCYGFGLSLPHVYENAHNFITSLSRWLPNYTLCKTLMSFYSLKFFKYKIKDQM